MAVPKYPNESIEYRQARDALLEVEKNLIAQVKAVAEQRRKLPVGGRLKEDYVFLGASDNTLGKEIRFSELFGDKNTLLLYSLMFGSEWDNPCPACTSLVDGFDRASVSVSEDAAFAVVAQAPVKKLNAWARQRGWDQINLLSAEKTRYLRDYLCQGGEAESTLWPIMHVFTRRDGDIYHFWASEMQGNHVDMIWAYWNLMDLTPEGRPDHLSPPQTFRSRFLEENYLGEKLPKVRPE